MTIAIGTSQHEIGRPLWAALLAADQPATIDELRDATDAPRNSVQHRLWLWERAGIVNRLPGRTVRYAMSDNADRAGGVPSVTKDARTIVRPRPARARLWTAMRVLHTFDLPQLALAAGGLTQASAAFLRDLSNAGYLAQIRAADPAKGTPSIYRLARNTGPKAPTISGRDMGGGRFARCVVDRNSGAVHELPGRASRATAGGGVG